eukprot:TRINITY_DN6467_c0_g1_i5.p1 TRINITY_DN6467_c0_g1~~TRINITY_DN6467_c0_g1_i5.p1  ORF type:complete len:551 (+),score=185.66 TRINITY_DN6467_c0_g1_i5:311-1963(+)
MTAIREEQEKRVRLERQLEELEKTHRNGVVGVEENLEAEKVRERIKVVEMEIEAEKKKGYETIKEIEGLRSQVTKTSSRKYTLEQRVEAMRRDLENLKEENARLRELRAFQKSNDDSKLSGLVREYEEKIEQEVQEKYRVLKGKQREIASAASTISQLNAAISESEGERLRLEDYYKSELAKLEGLHSDYASQLHREEAAKSQLLDLHNRNCEQADELRRVLIETGRRKEEIEEEMEEQRRTMEQMEFRVMGKQEEIEHSARRTQNLEEDIGAKEEELKALKEQVSADEGHAKEEIEKLKKLIKDKAYDNEDIQNKINVRQLEIDTLNKDVEAWKQVANNVATENDALKNIIEVLKDKNKRLADSLNSQLDSREKESKSRIVTLIKTSKSPLKIRQIISGTQNLQYTPERAVKASPSSPLPSTQANLLELQGNLLKALETFTEEPADEGKPLERHEKIEDPYLHEREVLREFESMVSPEKGGAVEEPRSTSKLISRLGIESPIRKRVAKDSLNPIPGMEVDDDIQPSLLDSNKAASEVTIVRLYISRRAF